MEHDTDRDDMRQLYRQILELKLDYAHIVEAGYDAIFFHFDGNIVGGNQAFADLCGCSQEETYGLNGFRLFPPESFAFIMQKIKEGTETPYEIDVHTMKGKSQRVSIWGMSFQLEGHRGRVVGVKKVGEI